MSTWAVFSMLGIYPDCPGEPYYTITTPRFERAEIDTPHGTIVITSAGKGDYIKDIRLGGKSVGYRISHADLVKAKELKLKLK
jgi:putative alpha-1,2-mannosidase